MTLSRLFFSLCAYKTICESPLNQLSLTMYYHTEKNKRESIGAVLMYNLQGQHLAAFFFLSFFCHTQGYWTILLEVDHYFLQILAAGQLK